MKKSSKWHDAAAIALAVAMITGPLLLLSAFSTIPGWQTASRNATHEYGRWAASSVGFALLTLFGCGLSNFKTGSKILFLGPLICIAVAASVTGLRAYSDLHPFTKSHLSDFIFFVLIFFGGIFIRLLIHTARRQAEEDKKPDYLKSPLYSQK